LSSFHITLPDYQLLRRVSIPLNYKCTCDFVYMFQGIKPERKPVDGKMVEDYWPAAKKLLSDMKFLESLKEYDKDNIPAATMTKIRGTYITNPEFDPKIIKNVSSAAEGLCKWVCALEVYDKVAKVSVLCRSLCSSLGVSFMVYIALTCIIKLRSVGLCFLHFIQSRVAEKSSFL